MILESKLVVLILKGYDRAGSAYLGCVEIEAFYVEAVSSPRTGLRSNGHVSFIGTKASMQNMASTLHLEDDIGRASRASMI